MVKTETASALRLPVWLVAITLCLLLVRFALALFECVSPPVAKEQINWLEPLPLSNVKSASDKLLFYDFRADWCGPCHEMEASSFLSRDVVRLLNTNYLCFKVTDRKREDEKNSPAIQELQDKFGVQGFPTIVVAMPDGTKVCDHLGAIGSSSLKVFLEDGIRLADYFQGKEEIIAGEPAEAAAAFDRFIRSSRWRHWRVSYATIFAAVAYRQLGQNDKADSVLHESMTNMKDHTFPYQVVEYLSGKRDFDNLLKKTGEAKNNRIACYAYAGMDYFARKKYEEARNCFEHVLTTPGLDKESFEFRIAKAELDRLDKLVE